MIEMAENIRVKLDCCLFMGICGWYSQILEYLGTHILSTLAGNQ